MKYDFDRPIDRTGSHCIKHEQLRETFGTDRVIPLWLADMDFAVPDFVQEALRRRIEHPIFGYTYRPQQYFEAIRGWVARHGQWELRPEWIAFSPGVVAGITFALYSCTEPGDGVVIQPPVYPPFAQTIRNNARTLLTNPLVETPDGYRIDFEDLDKKLAGARALILCNPHNPTGRVFGREELLRIGELCCKHRVAIISDEIHCDFVFRPGRHLHIAALSDALAERTLTLIAPSKSFNVAGLATAVAIIPNAQWRAAYQREVEKIHIDHGNIFGSEALGAAYRQGDAWLEELKAYLQGNVDFVCAFLRKNLPSVGCCRPEATFLMWLDFRRWGLSQSELNRMMVEEAGLGLGDGEIYGTHGEGVGFQRLNIGTRRAVLEQALRQLVAAAKRGGFE